MTFASGELLDAMRMGITFNAGFVTRRQLLWMIRICAPLVTLNLNCNYTVKICEIQMYSTQIVIAFSLGRKLFGPSSTPKICPHLSSNCGELQWAVGHANNSYNSAYAWWHCGKVPFQSVPCPENARPAYPDGSCWFPMRHPKTRHYWDEQCKWGMKGCWADGATWSDRGVRDTAISNDEYYCIIHYDIL